MNAMENPDGRRLRTVTVACSTRTLLVKLIQLCRVESPCFATRQGDFCTKPCIWRRDCRKPFTEWLRAS